MAKYGDTRHRKQGAVNAASHALKYWVAAMKATLPLPDAHANMSAAIFARAAYVARRR